MMTQDLGFAGLPLGCLKDVALSYISFLAATSLLKSKILKKFYCLRYRHWIMSVIFISFIFDFNFLVFKNSFILMCMSVSTRIYVYHMCAGVFEGQ